MATILVVDDKPANRALLHYLLGRAGHSVIEASDGEQAVAAAGATDVDLVVMDIAMPGVDGFTAARTMRGDRRLEGIPLLAVSATAYATDDAARQAGFDAFFPLPIDPETFVREIESRLPASAARGA